MFNKELLFSYRKKKTIRDMLKTANFWFEYSGFTSVRTDSIGGRVPEKGVSWYLITLNNLIGKSQSCSNIDYCGLLIYHPESPDYIMRAPYCILYSTNISRGDNYYGAVLMGDVFHYTAESDGTSLYDSSKNLYWSRSYDRDYRLSNWFNTVYGAGTFGVPVIMAFWKDGIPEYIKPYKTNLDGYPNYGL